MRLAGYCILGSFLIPSALSAQGTIIGAVVDSVRGGYLTHATVTVQGTARGAETDDNGRFKIDSVPTGSFSLEVYHPRLDTLGIRLRTAAHPIVESSSLIIGVPSPRTIVARRCSQSDREKGDAALVGMVLDAESDLPIDQAEVVVSWTDYQVGKKNFVSTPQRRSGKVAADGTYVVCGIPSDLETGATAHSGNDSTAAIGVSFASGLAVQSFRMPHSAVSSHTADVHGMVVDGAKKPVSGVHVAVDADSAAAISKADGSFTLTGVKPGTRRLVARKIGFAPVELGVDVRSVEPTTVTVTMANTVKVLETVRVTAMRDLGLQRVGFTARQKGIGGHFYTTEDIERRNPLRLNNFLENVPGLRAHALPNGKRFITGPLGECVRYVVDGFVTPTVRASDLDMLPDSYLSTAELGAIEVYRGLTAPPEYILISPSGQPCTVVVIWTKWKLGLR